VVIRAGSTLLVPRSSHMADVAVNVADNGQLSLAPEVVLKRSTVRAAKGDTVASIARKYKVSAATVAEWNKVSASASFKAGQQVVVFLPAKAHNKNAGAKSASKTSSKLATKGTQKAKAKVTPGKGSKHSNTKVAKR
jgi:membrane-bound lytic murein transglycosylase D